MKTIEKIEAMLKLGEKEKIEEQLPYQDIDIRGLAQNAWNSYTEAKTRWMTVHECVVRIEELTEMKPSLSKKLDPILSAMQKLEREMSQMYRIAKASR